jgi:hypothetical protein
MPEDNGPVLRLLLVMPFATVLSVKSQHQQLVERSKKLQDKLKQSHVPAAPIHQVPGKALAEAFSLARIFQIPQSDSSTLHVSLRRDAWPSDQQSIRLATV